MPLASFVKRNPGRLSHICAKKHLIVEISVLVVYGTFFVSVSTLLLAELVTWVTGLVFASVLYEVTTALP
jgi:hypothetical protein